jgi:preprotein translocase subunit SecD
VPPPSSNASRPGRALAVLAALIVVMFLAIVGGNVASPGKWSQDFKVKLGLDLTSGTTVALQAQAPPGHKVTQQNMTDAIQIMNARVNGAGFTEAQVEQQGTDIINVSVPNKDPKQVVSLVSQTAQLLFRQVLLEAPNGAPAPVPTPSPSASVTPTPTGSAKASPTPSAKNKAKASPSPSASGNAAGRPGQGSGAVGVGLTSSAHALPAAAVSASPSPKASPTPSATPTPSPTPTVTSPNHTSTWQQASGDPSLASAQTKTLFDKLNCANPKWKTQIGYTKEQWDNPNIQTVSCGTVNGQMFKFALDKSTVFGKDVHSAQAQPQQNTTFWEVLVNFNGGGTKSFGNLTQQLYNKYHGSTTLAQNEVAVVLDGGVASAESIINPILGGQAQITGSFDQASATSLSNVLSYGALPLTFHQQSVVSVTPQLGHDQLNAGLIAAALGLILVLFYLMFYYRGLAMIAASSLIIAAALSYEAVVLLGKYQNFALNLAGIAGLVVAIGITADSFVVFFERLRDEVRDGGKSLRSAVEHGWARARRTILVSDTVSFLAAALLYYFAIGEVRGFAFTLGLTTVIDVVVVFTFTKPMMTLLARTKFFGGGHRMSGLDPTRLGARAPWRGSSSRVPTRRPARPAPPKEA